MKAFHGTLACDIGGYHRFLQMKSFGDLIISRSLHGSMKRYLMQDRNVQDTGILFQCGHQQIIREYKAPQFTIIELEEGLEPILLIISQRSFQPCQNPFVIPDKRENILRWRLVGKQEEILKRSEE